MPWFLWLWAHSGWSSLLSRLSTSSLLPSGLWPLAWCWTVDLPPQALLGECVVQNYTWLFIMEEEYPIAVKVLEEENANWRTSTVAPFPLWNSALQTWLSPTKFQVVKPGLYQTPAALQRERTSKSQTMDRIYPSNPSGTKADKYVPEILSHPLLPDVIWGDPLQG